MRAVKVWFCPSPRPRTTACMRGITTLGAQSATSSSWSGFSVVFKCPLTILWRGSKKSPSRKKWDPILKIQANRSPSLFGTARSRTWRWWRSVPLLPKSCFRSSSSSPRAFTWASSVRTPSWVVRVLIYYWSCKSVSSRFLKTKSGSSTM